MKELLWKGVAKVVTAPRVMDWLVRRARRTPYSHLYTRDDRPYMFRYWLFNPYPSEADRERWNASWRAKLPSIRLHKIVRADENQDHPHDHPWEARTIILGPNGYFEERPTSPADLRRTMHWRGRGDTTTLHVGQYHVITWVPSEGVWTLFITWGYAHSWGFLVDGKKVPWRQYIRQRSER